MSGDPKSEDEPEATPPELNEKTGDGEHPSPQIDAPQQQNTPASGFLRSALANNSKPPRRALGERCIRERALSGRALVARRCSGYGVPERRPTGTYSRFTNSSTTHVGAVLAAGGVAGVPSSGVRMALWHQAALDQAEADPDRPASGPSATAPRSPRTRRASFSPPRRSTA
jgi:hypothetical protein